MCGRKEETPVGQPLSYVAIAIRTWRHIRKYSETELANLAHLGKTGKSYIWALEHGRIRSPGREKLERIAAALEIDANQLHLLAAWPALSVTQSTNANAYDNSMDSGVSSRSATLAAVLDRLAELDHGELAVLLERILHVLATPASASLRQSEEGQLTPQLNMGIQELLAITRRPHDRKSGAFKASQQSQTVTSLDLGLQVAISSIQMLSKRTTSDAGNPVIYTFHSESSVLDQSDRLRELQRKWWKAVGAGLRNGWDFVSLVDRSEIADVIGLLRATLLELPGVSYGRAGKYCLSYLPDVSTKPLPRYIVVPKRGVIEFYLSSEHGEGSEATVYPTTDPKFPLLLEQNRNLYHHSTPLLIAYPGRTEEFTQYLTRVERQPGNRCLLLDGISEWLVPMTIQRNRGDWLVRNKKLQASTLDKVLQSQSERQQILEGQLESGECKVYDLCPRRAIQRLVNEGIYSLDATFTTLGAPTLEDRDIWSILDRIIFFLSTFRESYFLGFVDDDSDINADENLWPSYWLAKQHHAVLMETWHPDPRGKHEQIDSVIHDPEIADSTYDYFFEKYWNRLPPVNKNRDAIIEWLRTEQEVVMSRLHAS